MSQVASTENKKKKKKTEVTVEEMTDFLSRPTPHVEDLNRNLRKSYNKEFFKNSIFDGFRELSKKMSNKQHDSVQSDQSDENDSEFSLHNDKRTLKRRERRKNQLKKARNKNCLDEKESQEKQTVKQKRRSTQNKMEEEKKEIVKTESSSSSSSSDSSDESSKEENSSKRSESMRNQEQNSQKSKESSKKSKSSELKDQQKGDEYNDPKQPSEPQRLSEFNQKRLNKECKQQNEQIVSQLPQGQAELQQQDKKSSQLVDLSKNNEQMIDQKAHSSQNKAQIKENKQIQIDSKLQHHQQSEQKQKITQRYPKQYRLLFNSEKEAETMLMTHPRSKLVVEQIKQEKSPQKNAEVIASSFERGKKSKISTKLEKKPKVINGKSSKKMTQTSKEMIIIKKEIVTKDLEIQGEPAQRGVIYRRQPIKKYHNLELCQKVIVQSLFFRSHLVYMNNNLSLTPQFQVDNNLSLLNYRTILPTETNTTNSSSSQLNSVLLKKRIIEQANDSIQRTNKSKRTADSSVMATRSRDKKGKRITPNYGHLS